jgi:hypothetical protein
VGIFERAKWIAIDKVNGDVIICHKRVLGATEINPRALKGP